LNRPLDKGVYARTGKPYLGFAIVGLGASIAPLDFAVNLAFPAMTEAFVLPTADIRWVAVFYVITYGSLMLYWGWAGVYGFRVPIVLLALLCTPWLSSRLRVQALSTPDATQPGSVQGLLHLMRRNTNFAWINLESVIVQFCSFTIALSLPYALPAAGWPEIASGAMLSLWELCRILRGVCLAV
jgi:hypothetical protein